MSPLLSVVQLKKIQLFRNLTHPSLMIHLSLCNDCSEFKHYLLFKKEFYLLMHFQMVYCLLSTYFLTSHEGDLIVYMCLRLLLPLLMDLLALGFFSL